MYLVSGTRCLVPGTRYLALGTRCLAVAAVTVVGNPGSSFTAVPAVEGNLGSSLTAVAAVNALGWGEVGGAIKNQQALARLTRMCQWGHGRVHHSNAQSLLRGIPS